MIGVHILHHYFFMLNLIIYSLRSKDAKRAMRKFFERNWFMEKLHFLILTQKIRLIVSRYVYDQKLGKYF